MLRMLTNIDQNILKAKLERWASKPLLFGAFWGSLEMVSNGPVVRVAVAASAYK